MSEKIKVLIADDHAVVRQGLQVFLGMQADMALVGEATNGEEAVALARQHRPDVVLLDLVMPKMDGIKALSRIKADLPETQVIVLTSFTEDDQVFPAIEAGAIGYLLKDVSPDDLAEAIRAAHRGEAQLHHEVIRKLMTQVTAGATQPKPAWGNLTERELEVLGLIATGLNNWEIGQALHISEKTVKTHVSHILGKLNLADRTQAAIYAHQHGLVS
ncbi:MAG: response regulator transcription factor [Chloroflexi bacterium]|nr:response regulator transcription factor [Chloroflexota bacterium]MCI0579419.1 response regulator transcription factor [Chloroflexota bacterium]MCI0648957.1 response regulator transcription factor [Chloroflexota bacterium]MCI0725816.1 response regulator transcription factor [Chloroflexota bacterium]